MELNAEYNLSEIVDRASSLNKSESNHECLEVTEKGLARLTNYPQKDMTIEFNLRFSRGIAYWNEEMFFEAFTQITQCLVLLENTTQSTVEIKMRKVMFCYLLCADLCTYISIEEIGIRALFNNAETFMRNAQRYDLLIVIKHLKSQVLYRIHKITEALPLAEEALAEKRLAKETITGCATLCYISVYANLLVVNGQKEQGLNILNEAMQDTTDTLPLHEQKGLIYLKAGDYNHALEEFNAALLFTTNADLLINRAWCYWFCGDKTSAQKDSEAAYLDDPGRLTVVLWYAFLHSDKSVMEGWTDTEDELESSLAQFWMGDFPEEKMFQLADKQQLRQQALTYAYLFAALKAEERGDMRRAEESYAYMSTNIPLDHFCYAWVIRRCSMIRQTS